jgi:hypothetical protein
MFFGFTTLSPSQDIFFENNMLCDHSGEEQMDPCVFFTEPDVRTASKTIEDFSAAKKG